MKSFLLSAALLLSVFATGSNALTPLQGHAAFFDRDGDGLIYPHETYEGLIFGCGCLALTLPRLLRSPPRAMASSAKQLPLRASNTSWYMLYSLAKDGNGFLPKEAVRGAVDGSLFFQIENSRDYSQSKV
ncbi:putative peroxygenase 4 isoform X2 [Canna indica]|uniref:Peroxygenase 4 isoform X2 n=1 Tax=Canna indica TaxID=4628 RepID=A0AAQ3PWX2_9LILI|nr:putative peroxygenase 4 isoform X2 [Canna indica]